MLPMHLSVVMWWGSMPLRGGISAEVLRNFHGPKWLPLLFFPTLLLLFIRVRIIKNFLRKETASWFLSGNQERWIPFPVCLPNRNPFLKNHFRFHSYRLTCSTEHPKKE